MVSWTVLDVSLTSKLFVTLFPSVAPSVESELTSNLIVAVLEQLTVGAYVILSEAAPEAKSQSVAVADNLMDWY